MLSRWEHLFIHVALPTLIVVCAAYAIGEYAQRSYPQISFNEFAIAIIASILRISVAFAVSLFLGVAYVIADKDIAGVTLAIGSDDSSVWRLNGKEVIRVFAGRGVEKDQDRSENPVTLKAGVNVLSFAVINGGGPTGAAARFLDKSDNPITNIKISLTPPAGEKK